MEEFRTEWSIEAGKQDQKLYEKIEFLERGWGVYPEQSPLYVSPCAGEFTFQDITRNPEYHALFNSIREFVLCYMKLAYLCNLKSGLNGGSPVTEIQIQSILTDTPDYRTFQELFPALEENLLATRRKRRIMSLYDKITALDLQTSVDIFAYIYCGYQDGCYLHTVMGERPISEDELEQLEYYCKNKAVSAKQIRPNAFKGVILPMIDFPKWNVEEG